MSQMEQVLREMLKKLKTEGLSVREMRETDKLFWTVVPELFAKIDELRANLKQY